METKELAARNELIMLDLIFHGYNLVTVADKYQMNVDTLRIIRKSPMWKKRERELLDERKEEYALELDGMVQPAMVGLKEMSQKMIKMPLIGLSGEVAKDEDGEPVEIERPNPPQVRMAAVKEILERNRIGGDGEHKPSLIQINMYNPLWNRKPGEEDKETITIEVDPDKKGFEEET